jgi:hypothetical protein
MLQLYVSIYLKSVLRYKFLTLDTDRPDTLHVRQQGYEDGWLFFEAKMGSAIKKVCETLHQTDAGTEPRLVPSASYKNSYLIRSYVNRAAKTASLTV